MKVFIIPPKAKHGCEEAMLIAGTSLQYLFEKFKKQLSEKEVQMILGNQKTLDTMRGILINELIETEI